MTKEELEKEAEEYVCKRNPLVTKEWFIDAFKKYDKGEKVKYLKDCEIAEYEAYLAGAEPREKRIANLEKENAELKEKLEVVIALKDEEIGCIETDFNTFKSQAKEIIKELVRVEYADFTNGDYSNELSKVLEQAEQFLNSEVEK